MTASAIPESALRLTSHEVLAMLSFSAEPGAELSRTVLGLANHQPDSDLVRAGLSTLHIRDMAQANEDDIALQGGALVLSAIMGTATQWFELTRYGATSARPLFVVESPHGKAVLFSQPLSQYLCVPLRPDLSLVDFMAENVNTSAAEALAMNGGLIVVRQHRVGVEPTPVNVKINADGTRELLAPPVQADGQLSHSVLDEKISAGAAVANIFRITH